MFTIHSTNYKVNENCRFAITFCICFATTSAMHIHYNATDNDECKYTFHSVCTRSNKFITKLKGEQELAHFYAPQEPI